MADLKRIAKGAEADIILDPNWNGKKAIIKRRNQKKYRHTMLDENIRRIRTIHEAEIIHRAKESGIPTPLIYLVNPKKAEIIMEYIEGTKIRDIVMTNNDEENTRIFYQIGIQAGKLHKLKIIHGDLTTSNMIKSGNRIVFIDFGLGEISEEVEKRGVDVNLMKKMLTSTHYLKQDILLSAFIKGYVASMDEEAKEVLDRAEEISKRGRYIEKE